MKPMKIETDVKQRWVLLLAVLLAALSMLIPLDDSAGVDSDHAGNRLAASHAPH